MFLFFSLPNIFSSPVDVAIHFAGLYLSQSFGEVPGIAVLRRDDLLAGLIGVTPFAADLNSRQPLVENTGFVVLWRGGHLFRPVHLSPLSPPPYLTPTLRQYN